MQSMGRAGGGFDRRLILIALTLALAACSDSQSSNVAEPNQAPTLDSATTSELPLTGRVTDAADILSAPQEAALTQRLKLLEVKTGHQMVVVTVPSLGGEDIAAYTLRLANQWGIGRKGFNDGVVLLIAPNEGKARIEIGSGLERTLPESLCSAIMETVMIPKFRNGDLPGGIDAGAASLIERLRHHHSVGAL
jgi:uncharacterized protein